MFEKQPIYPVVEDGEEKQKRADEELEAEDYVLHKVLVRPSISIFTVLKWIVIFICSSLGLAFLFFEFSKNFLGKFTENLLEVMNSNPKKVFLIFFILSICIFFVCFFKNFLIWIIHIYQKYSPEKKRRSCLFKPTCSEYAILALNKYGVIRGIPKILDRFKRCHGNKYRIDYP